MRRVSNRRSASCASSGSQIALEHRQGVAECEAISMRDGRADRNFFHALLPGPGPRITDFPFRHSACRRHRHTGATHPRRPAALGLRALSSRMARWLCQPPDTSTAYLRSGILLWVRVRRTLLSWRLLGQAEFHFRASRPFRPEGEDQTVRRLIGQQDVARGVAGLVHLAPSFPAAAPGCGDSSLMLEAHARSFRPPCWAWRRRRTIRRASCRPADKSQTRSIGPGRMRTNCDGMRVEACRRNRPSHHLFRALRSTP